MDRGAGWIQTYTGRHYWPHDPRPDDVSIIDIAHVLSNLCRYTGHSLRFFSVAEHSVHVSRLVPAPLALHGLLHDASEAYCGDMAKPTKTGLPDYQTMEAKNHAAISKHFGLPEEMPKEIHEADLLMLHCERAQLMKSGSCWMHEPPAILPDVGQLGLPPEVAEREFLLRFHEITTARAA